MSLPFVLVPARRLALALTFGASLAVLASCGGSVSRVSTFQPTRMVSFGDEVSAVGTGGTSTDGLKYSINVFKLDANGGAIPGVTDCAQAPVWNQVLAQSFGFVFAQCNPNAVPAASLTADLVAVPGATVADVEVQVATYRATKGFDSKVLVTIMAGLADVLNAYNTTYVGGGRTLAALNQATADVTDAGLRLAQLVNAITDSGQGGRVIYGFMPDLGVSPFATKQEALTPGSKATLVALSKAFNDTMRINVTNDGRYAAPVFAHEKIQAMTNPVNSLGFGVTNLTAGACTVALPNCRQDTLILAADGVTATTPSVHVWADDTHPGTNWHARVGSEADSRARNNPF